MSNDTDPQPASPALFRRKLMRRLGAVLLLGIVVFLGATSIVMVDETESVIVERLGSIVAVYDRPEESGLHFKMPWPIDQARQFDRRVQLFDPPGREIFTSDKKNITVDAFICWKIADSDGEEFAERPVVRFFQAFGSPEVAEARLESRVRAILTTRIGQVKLNNLLSVENSEAGPETASESLLESITADVQKEIMQRAEESQSLRDRMGLEIVDVRIKRINLPVGNHSAVFERMRSERQKIAEGYRSAGMAQNQVIKSRADRQYNEIISRAKADAERIRGEAEAKAIGILNATHARDPEFYKFMRTLDAYQTILGEETTLVLSASSPLLRLLTSGIPSLKEKLQPDPSPIPEGDGP